MYCILLDPTNYSTATNTFGVGASFKAVNCIYKGMQVDEQRLPSHRPIQCALYRDKHALFSIHAIEASWRIESESPFRVLITPPNDYLPCSRLHIDTEDHFTVIPK